MKIVPNRLLLTVLVFILPIAVGFAAPGPPPPSTPPPPPGLPIDQGIVFLTTICLLFGFYKIYKHQNTKKASN